MLRKHIVTKTAETIDLRYYQSSRVVLFLGLGSALQVKDSGGKKLDFTGMWFS